MSSIVLLMDSVPVVSPGGERLQVELSAALDRTCPADARALVLRRSDQSEIGGFSRIRGECVDPPALTRIQRWRWIGSGLPSRARRFGATAVFAAGGVVTSRLRRERGVIVSTNNMAPFLSPELLRGCSLLTKLRFRVSRRVVVRSLKMADAVVLHSQHALRTVSHFAGDIAPKTTVVLTGVPRTTLLDAAAVPPGHPREGRPYLLYFSAIRWYKNHLGLIEAYRQVRERVDDLPDLILAGICKDPDYLAAIRTAISKTSLNGRVSYIGELPRQMVASWLHHATINVFPSLAETNSVIQAEILGMRGVMASSGIPPMSEVAVEAAEYFDPRDPADIARVLEELWRRPERRDELRRLAVRRARELSWDACGEAIWRAARAATDRHRERTS